MNLAPVLVVDVLLLLLAANGAPVLLARVLGRRWAWPVDGGLLLWDGRPLFGVSKTWRGLAIGVAMTTLAGVLLGYGAGFGLLFGAASLAGDLCSSFIKRRMGIRSSGKALGIDQIPEALLPLLACRGTLGLDWVSMAALVALFLVGSLLLSRAMFRFGIKQQPY